MGSRYRNFHLRVSKSLEAKFNMATAEAVANKDWAEDITAFSGAAAELIWLEEVKKKFRDVTRNAVTRHGWKTLFARYDSDGSGNIDFEEFCTAARMDCHIRPDDLSDSSLRVLFSDADADGSGELDSEEFCALILREGDDGPLSEIKSKFCAATESVVNTVGWAAVFASYDIDGSGELDKDEFVGAVRQDCDIDENVLSDADLWKMFDTVDVDGSGEIDSEEFERLLESDALAHDMTFEVFFEAMFQLVDLWTADPPEVSNYTVFLDKMLKNITKATAGGTLTLRDLNTLFDEKGELMYELAPLEEIVSFVDETSGEVDIEGVEINENMMSGNSPPPSTPTPEPAPELAPEPESEPEWLPTEVVGSEVEARLPTPKVVQTYDAEAEAERLAREADERARRLAALEEEKRRREAARLAREAEEAERRRRDAERRAKMDQDVTIPLPRSQRDQKVRRAAALQRKKDLQLEEDQCCRTLEQLWSARPAWWAQVDRLRSNLTQLNVSKLDSKLLGKFATWTDARKLVRALIRTICETTADIDRNPSKGGNPHEAIAVAVAHELHNNGELAGLLRLVIGDADESGMVLPPMDISAGDNIPSARLLSWLQCVLATFVERSKVSSSSLAQSFPVVAAPPRGIMTPGTIKRRHVNVKKELLWREAQDSRTKRSKLQPRLRRMENTSGRKQKPNIAAARRKLQALSYSKDGQDPMKLFRQYDHDNSGDLDFAEFCNAVRKGGQMKQSMISDAELAALFDAVDGDGSGDISILELQAFVWESGGTTARGTHAKVAEVKLPTVGAHQTDDNADHQQYGSRPLPRYMQSRGPTNTAGHLVPPAKPRGQSAACITKIAEELTDRAVADHQVQLAVAPIPRPPPGSKLPLLLASRTQRAQGQRVSFSRERPTVRRIATVNTGPHRGGGTPRRWGPPGMLKPATPVYSSGRRFLPPESVDWSKSITARF